MQVETVETLEDGNRDEEQEEIEVMEEKDGASAGARKRKVGRLDSSKHLVQYNIIPNGRVSFLGLYQRKIIVKMLGCSVACVGGISVLLSTTIPQCGATFACTKTASGGTA